MPGTDVHEEDLHPGQKAVRIALSLAGQGLLHDSSMALFRLTVLGGLAQNPLDGSLLPGYNRVRVEEFERICSTIDPDFRGAAKVRARKKESEETFEKEESPEKIKSFMAERDRLSKKMPTVKTAEEFLRT